MVNKTIFIKNGLVTCPIFQGHQTSIVCEYTAIACEYIGLIIYQALLGSS